MFGTGGEWDPAQAKLLQPGQELFFYWNIATSVPGPAPRITLWLRYDVDRWGKT